MHDISSYFTMLNCLSMTTLITEIDSDIQLHWNVHRLYRFSRLSVLFLFVVNLFQSTRANAADVWTWGQWQTTLALIKDATWRCGASGWLFFGSDPLVNEHGICKYSLGKREIHRPEPPSVYAPSLNIPEWNVCRCGEAVIFFWHFCSSDDCVYLWSREHPLACPTSESPLWEWSSFTTSFLEKG